jgi:hypothetical protein
MRNVRRLVDMHDRTTRRIQDAQFVTGGAASRKQRWSSNGSSSPTAWSSGAAMARRRRRPHQHAGDGRWGVSQLVTESWWRRRPERFSGRRARTALHTHTPAGPLLSRSMWHCDWRCRSGTLTRQQLTGTSIRLRIEQTVCPISRAGLGDESASSRVRQASVHNRQSPLRFPRLAPPRPRSQAGGILDRVGP